MGASLASIETAAESSFLSYRAEPLKSKTNFWIGMFRNVEGSSRAAGVVIVVLLILMGAGVAAYFLYKKRRALHIPQEATFENTLYFDSHQTPGTSDTKDLMGNIEQNEHVVI
ncbi:Macrophage mannose receptor 1 [Cricetulus griseus]|uniref:Macrophage mannose receptor 1 n=1 Tax=Cricetulus griseus TaxID=10029 RepID=G3HHQ7_CRIGR|nr:Macrophage mannose receptor 1 [Cricetulus griseus]